MSLLGSFSSLDGLQIMITRGNVTVSGRGKKYYWLRLFIDHIYVHNFAGRLKEKKIRGEKDVSINFLESQSIGMCSTLSSRYRWQLPQDSSPT